MAVHNIQYKEYNYEDKTNRNKGDNTINTTQDINYSTQHSDVVCGDYHHEKHRCP